MSKDKDPKKLNVEELEKRVAPSALHYVEEEPSEGEGSTQSPGRDAGGDRGPGGGSSPGPDAP